MRKRLPILVTAVVITTVLCFALLFSVTSVAEATYATQRADELWNAKGTIANKVDWVLETVTDNGDGTTTTTETQKLTVAAGGSVNLSTASDYYTAGTAALSTNGVLTVTGAVQKADAPLLRMKANGALKIVIKGTDYPANVSVATTGANAHLLITSTDGRKLIAQSVTSNAGAIVLYGNCGLSMSGVSANALSIDAKGKGYPIILGGTVNSSIEGSNDTTAGLINTNSGNIEFCNETSSTSLTVTNTYAGIFELDGTSRGATVTLKGGAKQDSLILFKNEGPINVTCGSGHAIRNELNDVGISGGVDHTMDYQYTTNSVTTFTDTNKNGEEDAGETTTTTTPVEGTTSMTFKIFTESADAIRFEGDGKVTVKGTAGLSYSWRHTPGLVRCTNGRITFCGDANVEIVQDLTVFGKDSASTCAIALCASNDDCNPYAGIYVTDNAKVSARTNGKTTDAVEIRDLSVPDAAGNETVLLTRVEERLAGTWVNYGQICVNGNAEFTSYAYRHHTASADQCAGVVIKVGAFNVSDNAKVFAGGWADGCKSGSNGVGRGIEIQSGNPIDLIVSTEQPEADPGTGITPKPTTVTHSFTEGYQGRNQYYFKKGSANLVTLPGLNVTGGQLEMSSTGWAASAGKLYTILGGNYQFSGGIVLAHGDNHALSDATSMTISNPAYCGPVGNTKFANSNATYSTTDDWAYFQAEKPYTYFDGTPEAEKATPVLATNDGKTLKLPGTTDATGLYKVNCATLPFQGTGGTNYASKDGKVLSLTITKNIPARYLLVTETDGFTYVFSDNASDSTPTTYNNGSGSSVKGTLTFKALSSKNDVATINGVSGIRKIEAPTGHLTLSVSGTNVLDNPNNSGAVKVSYESGDLTVNGAGTLTATAKDNILYAPNGNLTVSNTTLNLTGQTRVIANATNAAATDKTMTVTNAKITLTAQDNGGTDYTYPIANEYGNEITFTGTTLNVAVQDTKTRIIYTKNPATVNFHDTQVAVETQGDINDTRLFLYVTNGSVTLSGTSEIKTDKVKLLEIYGPNPKLHLKDSAKLETEEAFGDALLLRCNVPEEGNNSVTFLMEDSASFTAHNVGGCPIRVRTNIDDNNMIPNVPVYFTVTNSATMDLQGKGQIVYLRSYGEGGKVFAEISGNATVNLTNIDQGEDANYYAALAIVSGKENETDNGGYLKVSDDAALNITFQKPGLNAAQRGILMQSLKNFTLEGTAKVVIDGAYRGLSSPDNVNNIEYNLDGGTLEIKNSSKNAAIYLSDNSTLNLNGTNVTINDAYYGVYAKPGCTINQTKGSLTVNNARSGIESEGTLDFNMTGGTITMNGIEYCGLYAKTGSSALQSGGTFTVNFENAVEGGGGFVISGTESVYEITDGTILINDSYDGIWSYQGGSFILTDGTVKIDTAKRSNIRITNNTGGAPSFTVNGGTLTLMNAVAEGVYLNTTANFTQNGGEIKISNTKHGINSNSTGAVKLLGGSIDVRAQTVSGYIFHAEKSGTAENPRLTIGDGATVTGYGSQAFHAAANAKTSGSVIMKIIPGARIKVQGFNGGHNLYTVTDGAVSAAHFYDTEVTYHEDCAMTDYGNDFIITANMPNEQLAVTVLVYDDADKTITAEKSNGVTILTPEEGKDFYPREAGDTKENATIILENPGELYFKDVGKTGKNVKRVDIEGTATLIIEGENIIDNVSNTANDPYENNAINCSKTLTITNTYTDENDVSKTNEGAILSLRAWDYVLMSTETLNLLGSPTINIEAMRLDHSANGYRGMGSPIHIARGTDRSTLTIRQNVTLNIGRLNAAKTGLDVDAEGNPLPSNGYGLYVPGTNSIMEILDDAKVNICSSHRGIYQRGDTVARKPDPNDPEGKLTVPDLSVTQESNLHIGGSAQVDVKSCSAGIFLEQAFTMYNDANEDDSMNLSKDSVYNNTVIIDGNAAVNIDVSERWNQPMTLTYTYESTTHVLENQKIDNLAKEQGIRLQNETKGKNLVDIAGTATVNVTLDRTNSGIYLNALENTTGNDLKIWGGATVTVDTPGVNLHMANGSATALEQNSIHMADNAKVSLSSKNHDNRDGCRVRIETTNTTAATDNVLTIQDNVTFTISDTVGDHGIYMNTVGTGNNLLTIQDTQNVSITGNLRSGIYLNLGNVSDAVAENIVKILNAKVTVDVDVGNTINDDKLKGNGLRIQATSEMNGQNTCTISNSVVNITSTNTNTNSKYIDCWALLLYNQAANDAERGNNLTINNGSVVTLSSTYDALQLSDRGNGGSSVTVDGAALNVTKGDNRGIVFLDSNNNTNNSYTVHQQLEVTNSATVNVESVGGAIIMANRGAGNTTVTVNGNSSVTISSDNEGLKLTRTGSGNNELTVNSATLNVTKAGKTGIYLEDLETTTATNTSDNKLSILGGAQVSVSNGNSYGVYLLNRDAGNNVFVLGDAVATGTPAKLSVKSRLVTLYVLCSSTSTGRNDFLVQGNAILDLQNSETNPVTQATECHALYIRSAHEDSVSDAKITTVGKVTMLGRSANWAGALELNGAKVTMLITAPDVTITNQNDRTVIYTNDKGEDNGTQNISNGIYLTNGATLILDGDANVTTTGSKTGAKRNRAHGIFSGTGGTIELRGNSCLTAISESAITSDTGAGIHLKGSDLTVTDNAKLYLIAKGTATSGMTIETAKTETDSTLLHPDIWLSGNAYMVVDTTQANSEIKAIRVYYDGSSTSHPESNAFFHIENNGVDHNAILVFKGKPIIGYRWDPANPIPANTVKAELPPPTDPDNVLNLSAAPVDNTEFTAWIECFVLVGVMGFVLALLALKNKNRILTKLKHCRK